jgi:hypothetical protein
MLRRLLILSLTGFVGAALLWTAPAQTFPKRKVPHTPVRVMGAANQPGTTVPFAPWRPPHRSLDEQIGIVDTAGTTWYDYQHNGTCGKMIAVDGLGIVSVVWMNGLTENPDGPRHVFYNVWDPSTGDFLYEGGIRVDAAQRAGYVTQATNADGFCFPGFHQVTTNSRAHAAAAGDYSPYSDAFTTVEPDWCYENGTDMQIIWPKIAMDIHGNLHMISTESPADDNEVYQRIYYSRGLVEYDAEGYFLDIHWDEMGCGGFELMDTVTTISPDIACSRHSERVVIAYTEPMFHPDEYTEAPGWHQRNNEVYLRISEDGGLNWGEPVNVTRWTQWDPACWYSTYDITCNRDTFRAYTDCAVLLDEEDNIHVAFTTPGNWWYLSEDSDTGLYATYSASLIWHWNEATGYYSLVAKAWYEASTPADCGAWQYRAQRPSLAIDTTTGYLYCSFMKYDTLFGEDSYPLSDAFVTVSTDSGKYWAAATNVSRTLPDVIPAQPGDCLNERDISVAELVTDGCLHMEYILDGDAGGCIQDPPEGVATLNPVIYQRIPVDSIPTEPLLPPYPMHWDSSGFPTSARILAHQVPEQFLLYPNYPNPFNPTTTIQFDLTHPQKMTLKVFNVLGQEVTTLLNKAPLSAGVHHIEFDGSNLPSGIYFYRLQTAEFAATRKMVLLK